MATYPRLEMNKHYYFGLILCLLTVFQNAIAIDYRSRNVKVHRNGKSKLRVIYKFWSGEYPEPVIDVGQHDRGFTTIKAFASMEKLDIPVQCTILNGLYHPWVEEKLSLDAYYTIAGLTRVKILDDTTFDEYQFKSGDYIDGIYFLEDNFCSGLVHTAKKDYRIEFQCGRFKKAGGYFDVHEEDPNYYEQWLAFNCKEGYQAYARDQFLLKQPNIKPGEIVEHGKVRR